MKKKICLLLLLINSANAFCVINEQDSLLLVLDATIANRLHYIQQKESAISDLKQRKQRLINLEDVYHLNDQIIGLYEPFICDSAELYIRENIEIAHQLKNNDYLQQSWLKLAFIYSLSGLFVQAEKLFNLIDFRHQPDYVQILYCWNIIRYYENLIKYTDDTRFSAIYEQEKEAYRDSVMMMLSKESPEYLKERAVKLQMQGKYEEALQILYPIVKQHQIDTHGYAMEAMGMAKIYRGTGNREQEKKYLTLAAITDTRLSVKENEALLTLAINLYEEGDIKRAYNYIKAALDDAIYYNSRFRNSVIARVHPIIEDTYLKQIGNQQRGLRVYALLLTLFALALAITLYVNYRQTRIVSKARRYLKQMNGKLISLNERLDETNTIKEKYIGYFMNQCAVYINRLNEFRKLVNRKIKTGQLDELQKLSARPFEKEIEELFANFDKAFLELYPHFIEEFNSLLQPQYRYQVIEGHLNTELRIFSLIRLGITDMGQIAAFLNYSVQTIYNLKSKVKKAALSSTSNLEETVQKLGTLS
jgi:DNA-binding CsgD family transcriptional regulator